ncbi:TetR/AcrR family transcriptional regulator, partial [Dielma fastidiosa]
MARNKYPEQTVEKILEVSLKLFSEKGYEKTTMQDIVNALGMSKGAIYHHFKSKEELVDAVSTYSFMKRNSFVDVYELKHLNGLQKLRWVLMNE